MESATLKTKLHAPLLLAGVDPEVLSVTNPLYKDAFFDRGDETIETWNEYGMESVYFAIKEIHTLVFPLIVFRGVSSSEDEIDITEKLDHAECQSWSTDAGVAQTFGNHVFRAVVNSIHDIDITATIVRRILYHSLDEQEIVVPEVLNLSVVSKLTN